MDVRGFVGSTLGPLGAGRVWDCLISANLVACQSHVVTN